MDGTVLNSQMRRIDLLCKLFGPLFIGLIDGVSTRLAIGVTLWMNCISSLIEYYAIAKVSIMFVTKRISLLSTSIKVYQMSPNLKKRCLNDGIEPPLATTSHLPQAQKYIKKSIRNCVSGLKSYFKHEAFRASFACAILYCTVLSFAGQMITYLLSVGYTSTHVALARTISVVFEISATWLAPWLMLRIGPVRTGMWFVSWQSICLVIGVAVYWKVVDAPMVAGLSLVIATILSRVGLWGFDLSTQIIVQEVSNLQSYESSIAQTVCKASSLLHVIRPKKRNI